MAEPDRTRPLLADLGDELRALGSELRESLVLRWQLALLELRADRRSAVRLAIGVSASGVMALSALPLLLVWLAAQLDQWLGVSRDGWLLILGLALLLSGLASGYLAWRRFRRRFLGLEQTLEELREDAAWLREWSGRR
jgi:hypothetical protein